MFFLRATMKSLFVFALVLATVLAKDLNLRSIEKHVFENRGRITNGQKAAPGQFKYQAGISFNQRQWCGGSLIDKNWVLTAAHCTHNATSVTVYLGATQRNHPEQVYNVSKSDIIIHPDFKGTNFANDISLIMIPTTSESSRIGFVKIPSNDNNNYVGYSVIASGWGITSDNSHFVIDDLQNGIMKVAPGSDCFHIYGSTFNNATNICIATPGDVSTCYGDSGGPIVLEGQNLQIALDSYGSTSGCTKGFPLGSIRVSAYLPWIRSHTRIARVIYK